MRATFLNVYMNNLFIFSKSVCYSYSGVDLLSHRPVWQVLTTDQPLSLSSSLTAMRSWYQYDRAIMTMSQICVKSRRDEEWHTHVIKAVSRISPEEVTSPTEKRVNMLSEIHSVWCQASQGAISGDCRHQNSLQCTFWHDHLKRIWTLRKMFPTLRKVVAFKQVWWRSCYRYFVSRKRVHFA